MWLKTATVKNSQSIDFSTAVSYSTLLIRTHRGLARVPILDTFDIFYHILYVTLSLPMDNGKSKEDLYEEAKSNHTSLDRRLQMLLKKPFLTESEEIEVRELKKKKLYYKDLMERLKKGQQEA